MTEREKRQIILTLIFALANAVKEARKAGLSNEDILPEVKQLAAQIGGDLI